MLIVGEIGIERNSYLYELKFWEIRAIIRGYYRRFRSGWEQARLVAYCAAHCMGSKETPPSVEEWIKFPWQDEIEEKEITLEEYDDLQDMIRAENERLKEEAEH